MRHYKYVWIRCVYVRDLSPDLRLSISQYGKNQMQGL